MIGGMNYLNGRITVALLLATILPLLDSSLVNVLLPSISADFGVSEASAQLGISTYMLAATAGIVLSTTLLRRFGSRRIWIASVVVFVVASTAVGCSTSVAIFVIARIVQGAACGFIMPAVQNIAVELVGKDGMRAVLATIGLPAVIAPAFGPLFGGVLVETIGWRPMFIVNIPLGLTALLLANIELPKSYGSRVPIGIKQASAALAGMVGLLWCISSIGSMTVGWLSMVFVLSVSFLSLFCYMDLKASAPLLDVAIFKNIRFAIAMMLCFLVGLVFYGTLLSTSLHIQTDLGKPAWCAGCMLAVQGVGAWAVRSLIKGPWKAVNPFQVIAAGLILSAIGTVGIQLVTQWSAVQLVVLFLSALIRGLGIGGCTLMALSAAYEVVTADDAGVVGAHTRLMLQLGGALGAAAVGVWSGSAIGLGVLTVVMAFAGALASLILVINQRQSKV